MAIYPASYVAHLVGPADSPLERDFQNQPMIRVTAYSYSEARKEVIKRLPADHKINFLERRD